MDKTSVWLLSVTLINSPTPLKLHPGPHERPHKLMPRRSLKKNITGTLADIKTPERKVIQGCPDVVK